MKEGGVDEGGVEERREGSTCDGVGVEEGLHGGEIIGWGGGGGGLIDFVVRGGGRGCGGGGGSRSHVEGQGEEEEESQEQVIGCVMFWSQMRWSGAMRCKRCGGVCRSW